MRYEDSGNVHMDFHRTTNGTIAYLRRNYGLEFLDEIFRRTARRVYRVIREDLIRGNPEHLVEHWEFYLDREGGEYTTERTDNEIRMTVHRCPAYHYLINRGIEPDPAFRRQTVVLNEALGEGTPFEIITEVLGADSYVQVIRRREP